MMILLLLLLSLYTIHSAHKCTHTLTAHSAPPISIQSARNHLSSIFATRENVKGIRRAEIKPNHHHRTQQWQRNRRREEVEGSSSSRRGKKIELRVTTKEIHVHTKRNFKNKLNERDEREREKKINKCFKYFDMIRACSLSSITWKKNCCMLLSAYSHDVSDVEVKNILQYTQKNQSEHERERERKRNEGTPIERTPKNITWIEIRCVPSCVWLKNR